MICEECQKQYKPVGKELSFTLYGFCRECGNKTKFHHVLYGYWIGIALSAIPFYIFLLGSVGGLSFILPSTVGPTATFLVLYYLVMKIGKENYPSKKAYDKYKFSKELFGAIIGFTSIMLWFFLGLNLGS